MPIHFADPLVRRAPSLQKSRDADLPAARMSAATLAKLGLADGAVVKIKSGQGEAALLAQLDAGVAHGCVRVSAAHATTAALASFAALVVERA